MTIYDMIILGIKESEKETRIYEQLKPVKFRIKKIELEVLK
jgi:hypothetical protein